MAVATATAILIGTAVTAAAAAGTAAYSAQQTREQASKARRQAADIKAAENAEIQRRATRIANIRTRLFETEGGEFGEQATSVSNDNKVFGN